MCLRELLSIQAISQSKLQFVLGESLCLGIHLIWSLTHRRNSIEQ